MLSKSRTVEMRWAMVITVTPLHSLDIVLWSKEAVWTSMFAVHSSRHKILDDLSRARARHKSCLCPTEKEHPDSFTFESNPPAISTSALTLHLSKISQILQSSLSPRGSRLSLQEVENRKLQARTRSWFLKCKNRVKSSLTLMIHETEKGSEEQQRVENGAL